MAALDAVVHALLPTIYYSTNVRYCCKVRRNFNVGEGKGLFFYMVIGAYRVFQGKTERGIFGERARLGLDNVYPAMPGTGHFCLS